MAYRIIYGKKEGSWMKFKLQSVIAGVLLAAGMLCRLLWPDFLASFFSEPNPAQQALAEAYARGEGIRSCAVVYCASKLEWAGYETEILH